MIDNNWKKKRRESFVQFMAQENDMFDTSIDNVSLLSVLVDYLIDDLCMRFTGKELEDILNDDFEMLQRYIAYLQTRLELGHFLPLQ